MNVCALRLIKTSCNIPMILILVQSRVHRARVRRLDAPLVQYMLLHRRVWTSDLSMRLVQRMEPNLHVPSPSLLPKSKLMSGAYFIHTHVLICKHSIVLKVVTIIVQHQLNSTVKLKVRISIGFSSTVMLGPLSGLGMPRR